MTGIIKNFKEDQLKRAAAEDYYKEMEPNQLLNPKGKYHFPPASPRVEFLLHHRDHYGNPIHSNVLEYNYKCKEGVKIISREMKDSFVPTLNVAEGEESYPVYSPIVTINLEISTKEPEYYNGHTGENMNAYETYTTTESLCGRFNDVYQQLLEYVL